MLTKGDLGVDVLIDMSSINTKRFILHDDTVTL